MQQEPRFRVGLVGAGQISEYHVAALRRLPHVRIVGVFDLDPAKAQALAEKHRLPSRPSLPALRDAGANVIHILTPPASHAALTLQSLDMGCHVLVEKPLALDVDDCHEIAKKAAETARQVCVDHSLLFDPQVRRALDVVRSGKLGKIVAVDILRSSMYPPYPGGPLPPHYRTAGYPFRDLGVHALYLLEAILGPIDRVQADWASLGGDPNLAFDEWRAQVHCRDGLGQCQLSWNVRPLQSQIIIQGTRGVLRVDLFLMFQARRASTPLPKAAERLINAMTDSLKPLIDVPRGIYGFLRKKVLPYHGLQSLVAEFYRALDGLTPVPVTIEDATRIVHWTEHVARAADEDYHRRISPFKLSDRVDVLVTGASGALGSEVVHRMCSLGKRVRILVRRPPPNPDSSVEVAIGNLGDPHAVDRALCGARTVIHVGAAMKGAREDHDCATIRGTRNVLDACLRHGVEKLVHISSLSVVDWAGGKPGSPISESTPFEPRPDDRGHYTRAKLAAERLVLDFVRDHNLPAIILRPGQIFGGRIPLLTPAVARKLRKRWLVLGNGSLHLPLIHMNDVVDAIQLAAEDDLAVGGVIQLVQSDPPTQNEVLALTLGPQARIIHLPRPLVFMLGAVSEILFKLLRRKSPFARYRLRSALTDRTFVSTESHMLPGWLPRVNVRDIIAPPPEIPVPQPTTAPPPAPVPVASK